MTSSLKWRGMTLVIVPGKWREAVGEKAAGKKPQSPAARLRRHVLSSYIPPPKFPLPQISPDIVPPSSECDDTCLSSWQSKVSWSSCKTHKKFELTDSTLGVVTEVAQTWSRIYQWSRQTRIHLTFHSEIQLYNPGCHLQLWVVRELSGAGDIKDWCW